MKAAIRGIQIRVHGDEVETGFTFLNSTHDFHEIAVVPPINELTERPVIPVPLPRWRSRLSAVCKYDCSLSTGHAGQPFRRPVERTVEVFYRDLVFVTKRQADRARIEHRLGITPGCRIDSYFLRKAVSNILPVEQHFNFLAALV